MYVNTPSILLRFGVSLLYMVSSIGFQVQGQDLEQDTTEIWNLSIEDLLNVPIVSASKTQSSYFEMPASVSVIFGSDLSLWSNWYSSDNLRYVTGAVVQKDSPSYENVGIRGFSGLQSNKVLTIKDGRMLYSPAMATAYWPGIDLIAENIDRIEVVRGPGGATWGVNAVNGVISIVSKSAYETLGDFLTVSVNSLPGARLSARYGFLPNDMGAARVYVKHQWTGETSELDDRSIVTTVGVQYDLELDSGDLWMVQAEYAMSAIGEASMTNDPALFPNNWLQKDLEYENGSILSRWNHLSDPGEFTLRTYYDYSLIDSALAVWKVHTFDVDFSFASSPTEHHQLSTGMGFRMSSMTIPELGLARFTDDSYLARVYNVYAQDELRWLEDKLKLQIGSKFEYLTHGEGFVYEPRVSLSWIPNERNHVWIAAARAVRVPSLIELELEYMFTALTSVPTPYGQQVMPIYMVKGQTPVDSEKTKYLEVGYRLSLNDKSVFNLTVFHNHYEDIVDTTPLQLSQVYPGAIETIVGNFDELKNYGIEANLSLRPSDRWAVDLGFSHEKWDQLSEIGSTLVVVGDDTPKTSASARVTYLSEFGLKGYVGIRYVGSTRMNGAEVSGYTEVDMSLRYRIHPQVEIVVSGQNLLNQGHDEYLFYHRPNGKLYEVQRIVGVSLKISF